MDQAVSEIENDSQFILSTQIQSKLEKWEEDEVRKKKFSSVVDGLNKYKYSEESEKTRDPVAMSTIAPKKRKKRVSKVKSITSKMTEKYGRSNERVDLNQLAKEASNDNDRYLQASIFELLSGKRQKVSFILKKIESLECETGERAILERQLDRELNGNQKENAVPTGNIVYSRNEWSKILKSIKKRFPQLSRSTKKSLGKITRLIDEMNQNSTQDADSLWSTASAPPQIEFTQEDLKWLYDLDDVVDDSGNVSIDQNLSFDASGQPFVLTLSQALVGDMDREPLPIREAILNANMEIEQVIYLDSETDEEEIPNSSPNMSPLLVAHKTTENSFVLIDDTYDNEEIDILGSDIEINEIGFNESESVLTNQKDTISSHQKPSMTDNQIGNIDSHKELQFNGGLSQVFSFERASPFSQLENLGTQKDPIELSSLSNGSKSKKISVEEQASQTFPSSDPIQILESLYKPQNDMVEIEKKLVSEANEECIFSSPLPSASNSPTKNAIFKTPRKIRGGNDIVFDSSPLSGSPSKGKRNHRLAGSPASPTTQSIYSTARSQLSQTPPSKKRFRRSIVEFKGPISISKRGSSTPEVQVIKIGTKKHVDNTNEVPDSESDSEEDVSIIEIIKPVESHETATDPILQVPTSPIVELGTDINSSPSYNSNPSIPIQPFFSAAGSHSSFSQVDQPIESISQHRSNIHSATRAAQLASSFVSRNSQLLNASQTADAFNLTQSQTSIAGVGGLISSRLSTAGSQNMEERLASEKELFKMISVAVKADEEWFGRILSFEPIRVGELRKFLEEQEIHTDLVFVKKYCDQVGVSYLAAANYGS